MFAKMGLSTKLYLGFGAVVAVIIALCGFLYLKLKSVEALEKIITGDCLPGMASVGRLESLAREIYERVPEHINSRDAAAKLAFEAEMAKMHNQFNDELKG